MEQFLRNVRPMVRRAASFVRRAARIAYARIVRGVRWAAHPDRRPAIAGTAVVVCVVIAGGMWMVSRWRVTLLPPMRPPAPPPLVVETKPRWIDGAPIPTDAPQPLAIAVGIDNAPEARPQTGIADAPLVFEVPMEGQRTRFLAVYPAQAASDDEVSTASDDDCPDCASVYANDVGPIRSARTYLVGLADALEVPYAHAGGSPAAITLLQTRVHVDEWTNAPYRRSRTRVAPFNLYAAIGDVADFLSRRQTLGESRTDGWHLWSYADEWRTEGVRAPSFTLRYGGERAFGVSWAYDAIQHVYVRSQGGQIHRDMDGDPVTATNVVVLRVDSVVLDRVGRLAIPQLDPPIREPNFSELLRRPAAQVYTNGNRVEGWWSWEQGTTDAGRFGLRRMVDGESGEPVFAPISLRPGTTWVEVVNFNTTNNG